MLDIYIAVPLLSVICFIFVVYDLVYQIVGNPNPKKMHIFGFVGILDYIC